MTAPSPTLPEKKPDGGQEILALIEAANEGLWRAEQWAEAYPIDVFPEPDLKEFRRVLEAGGLTIDRLSAHCMRHVAVGIDKHLAPVRALVDELERVAAEADHG